MRGNASMTEDQRPGRQHLYQIAEKIRQLARQALPSEAQQELFDLADQIDRMADWEETCG
jgi:hypothetical protein